MPTSPASAGPSSALVVFADAALHRSRLSRRVGNAARGLPGVRVQDLYELYPDFYIDVRTERPLLKEAALLVLCFPLRWYGMPSLLKEWFDAVLRPEWAAADGCLRGKRCWAIVECDGQEQDYRPGARHGRALADYLQPLEQTARACGMRWLAPHVYYDAGRASAQDVDFHALKLRTMITRELHGPSAPGDGDGA